MKIKTLVNFNSTAWKGSQIIDPCRGLQMMVMTAETIWDNAVYLNMSRKVTKV